MCGGVLYLVYIDQYVLYDAHVYDPGFIIFMKTLFASPASTFHTTMRIQNEQSPA
jgi:hypothetical protein